jgi:hypothetical protein
MIATVVERCERWNLFRALGRTSRSMAYAHNEVAYVFLYQFRQDVDTLIDPNEFYLFRNRLLESTFPGDWEVASQSDRFLFDIRKGQTLLSTTLW